MLNYTLFKTQKANYLQKSEQIDRVFSGLCQCQYARFLNYELVEEIERYVFVVSKNEDVQYFKGIFQKVYGLFEINILYNMQIHRIQPAEVVLAIIFYLDKEQKDCVTQLGTQFMKDHGDQWGADFDLVVNVSEKIIENV
ncbi:Hypothetical_protein [Hexamita inflata]